jgi:Mg2+ and Co2+ transporter CorA
MSPPYILQEGLPVHIFFVPTVYLLDENVIMATIYVRKQHPDKDDENINTWFDFQPTTDADKKQLASRTGLLELVAKAAVEKGTKKKCPYDDEDFADEISLYVWEEKELVVITNANFATKTKDVVELYAYVPAPPAPTTANNEGGGGDQGKLVCCGLFVFASL